MTNFNKKQIHSFFLILLLSFLLCWMSCQAATEKPPKVVFTADFETGTDGFEARGGKEVLSQSDEAAYSGTYSLKVENRSSSWHGPIVNVAPYVREGKEYVVSVRVKLLTPESAQIRLSSQTGTGNASTYNTIAINSVSQADGWVAIEGKCRFTNTGSGSILIYVESPNSTTASFYIDDICLEETNAMELTIEKIPALKDTYKNQFLIGNIVSPVETGGGIRFELMKKHFNVLTAENAMKPSSLQREKGIFTFEDADNMVNAVLAAGLKMHGHTLAWHQQSGAWMNPEGIPRDEAIENLVVHAKTVAEHFKGRVISWDVLNEAIIDNPPTPEDWKASLRQSGWLKAIGPEYVEIVFMAAREADPDAMLYYNDYNLDNQSKSIAVYHMVKELNEKYPDVGGRPLIDGIGMQGHYRVNTNTENVTLSLERFISLGVEISVTELDVQAGADSTLSKRQAIEQGIVYARLFSIYKEHAAHIKRITVWGLDDKRSWRSATNPTLFDQDLKAKPAFYGALNPEKFTKENQILLVKDAKQAEAFYGTPVIDGKTDALWDNVPEMPINQFLMAWQGASGTAKALWDEQNLYVLIRVQGAEKNKANPAAHEQDSVEVFVDENNKKNTYFEEDDGQYRVNFDNEQSFNPARIAAGFSSATSVDGTSYVVEMKIPFRTITPKTGSLVGFDVQINGASSQGIRQSIAIWNDTTGNAFQDPSGYGVLKLIKK